MSHESRVEVTGNLKGRSCAVELFVASNDGGCNSVTRRFPSITVVVPQHVMKMKLDL